MKKILVSLLVLAVLVLTVPAFAAAVPGNCAVANANSGDQVQKIVYSCTGNSSDGTFPATGFASSDIKGWVYDVEFKPGTTAPNAGSVTLIKSSDGADVLGGNGASVLGASGSDAVPAKSGWVVGTLQPVITGNSTASATFTITVWIWRMP